MDTLDAIMSRSSVRQFTQQEISDEDLKKILMAGMSGPSCVNSRDWSFIVVREKQTLDKMADANGKYAGSLRKANVGILICGDLEKAYPVAKQYWVIDGAIAAQNMILAAESLGIGSVWLGTWPEMDRVKQQAELFNLPETQIPHSIIAFGYPLGAKKSSRDVWEEACVHYENW